MAKNLPVIKKNASRTDIDKIVKLNKPKVPKDTRFNKLINDKFDDILKEVEEEEDVSKSQMKMARNFTKKRRLKASSLDHSIERSIKVNDASEGINNNQYLLFG